MYTEPGYMRTKPTWVTNWGNFRPPKRGFPLFDEGVELTTGLAAELISIYHKALIPLNARDEWSQPLTVNIFVLPLNKPLFYIYIEGDIAIAMEGRNPDETRFTRAPVRRMTRRDFRPIFPEQLGRVVDLLADFQEHGP